ncbi:hypothetical protein [Flavobacterium sp. 245]|uniref:hypothetical protein n=1 Tax=Flavobacterium sp. 245 TaxID=2512115 RepID=UPI00105DFA4A|nr:hypothetical protein [Flavobacterium sp. 245]TDO94904.1 hypothetical protein EV145_11628 [Flavobacterium sp. 245]
MGKNIFYFLFLVLCMSLFIRCTNKDTSEEKANYDKQINAADLPKGNRPMTMFEDDESPSIMYDNKDRWFRVNQLMQVIQKGKDSVQISLYSPVGLTDVKVYAKLANYDKRFLIYEFSQVPAFHRSFHQLPLANGKHNYKLENGETVTIDKINDLSSEEIKFSVESNDPLYVKLKKIKSARLVQFSDQYHKIQPDRYLPMNPVLAKEAILMIINYSYVLSHPLYYDTFMNYDKYIKEQGETDTDGSLNWHGNAVDVDGVYDYFTKAQIEQVYSNYIDGRTLNMAMVGGENPWGGGPLASQFEVDYVVRQYIGLMGVWSHEYSHHSGYDHSSNLCLGGDIGGGQRDMLANLYKYLIYLNDLPFTDADILKGYTKTGYLLGTYKKPIFTIDPKNPFLLKYKGEGSWK